MAGQTRQVTERAGGKGKNRDEVGSDKTRNEPSSLAGLNMKTYAYEWNEKENEKMSSRDNV